MDIAHYPAPVANADSKPYWDAARESRLVLPHCLACSRVHFPPRHLCPHCWSDRLDWRESTGRGTVHTFTVMRRAPTPAFAERVPYVVALIDLEDGVRMMGNILGEGAFDVAIGDRVEVFFEDRGEGARVPQFRLAR